MTSTEDPYDYVELILDGTQTAVGLGGYTPFDWPLYKLAYPLQQVKQLKVLEVVIPATYYSIQGWNNTFTATVAAVNYTVTLAPGNYSSTTITGALQAALTAAVANGWIVTYSPVTNKLRVQGTAPFTLTFGTGGDLGQGNPRNMLGFQAGPNVSTGIPGILDAPNVINLSGPNWIYIFSRKLGTFVSTYTAQGPFFDGNQNPIVAKIPVNVNTDGMITWQDPAPDHWFMVENLYNLGELDFYLMSPELQLLQLNGMPWSIKVGVIYQSGSVSKDRESQYQNNRVVKRIRPY